MSEHLRVAFIQDTLPFQGGAEKVLSAALEAFPDAPIYTLIYRSDQFRGTRIASQTVHASILDRLPAAHTHHRLYLPMMPFALRQFDLSAFDVLISFSYAVAHGILKNPRQLHINYVHTPLRYAWQEREQLLTRFQNPVRALLNGYLVQFQKWDLKAAAGVDHFLTVSHWMAACVEQAYHRPAQVIYPPVDLERFQPQPDRKDFYVTLSRLVAHKRLDLVIDAFNQLGLPLIVIGEGPQRAQLQNMAKANVRFTGWLPDEQLSKLLGEARGFVHAAREDFGIAMAEAQASGCPVIAYGQGAAPEIVQDGLTGRLFDTQSSASLIHAINWIEEHYDVFDPALIRQNAGRFDRERFIGEFSQFVTAAWSDFTLAKRNSAGTLGREELPAQHTRRTSLV